MSFSIFFSHCLFLKTFTPHIVVVQFHVQKVNIINKYILENTRKIFRLIFTGSFQIADNYTSGTLSRGLLDLTLCHYHKENAHHHLLKKKFF